MKYIVQLFETHDSWEDSDTYCMFQVIFSAKSKAEAKKKSASVFRQWKKENVDYSNLAKLFPSGITYKSQTMPLNEFIKMKQKQYKVCFAKK